MQKAIERRQREDRKVMSVLISLQTKMHVSASRM